MGKTRVNAGLLSQMSPQEIVELLQFQLAEMEPPVLSRDLFAEGGDSAVSAIVASFERNSGFLDLASQCRGKELAENMRRTAEMLLRRAAPGILKLDADATPEEVHAWLQRELVLMSAL